MPHLEGVYGDLKKRGIEIIGYNCADENKIAEDFIKDNKLSYPNVLDTSEEAQKVCFQDYQRIVGMSAVPLNYIIDGKGKIVEGWYGFDKKEAHKIFDRLKSME
jgi:peroxiredoxin